MGLKIEPKSEEVSDVSKAEGNLMQLRNHALDAANIADKLT